MVHEASRWMPGPGPVVVVGVPAVVIALATPVFVEMFGPLGWEDDLPAVTAAFFAAPLWLWIVLPAAGGAAAMVADRLTESRALRAATNLGLFLFEAALLGFYIVAMLTPYLTAPMSMTRI